MASLNTPELQIRETMLERSLSAVSSPFLVPQERYRNAGEVIMALLPASGRVKTDP